MQQYFSAGSYSAEHSATCSRAADSAALVVLRHAGPLIVEWRPNVQLPLVEAEPFNLNGLLSVVCLLNRTADHDLLREESRCGTF